MTARSDLTAAVAEELLQFHPRGRIALAVDGSLGADTESFADDLAVSIASSGRPVVRVSSRRWTDGGEGGASTGYRSTSVVLALRSRVVEPFRSGEPYRTTSDSAQPDSAPAGPDTVLIIDGEFLLRPELRGLWHAAVRLETVLDPSANGDRRVDHETYEREATPIRTAGIVVDVSDPERPLRRFVDYC